MHEKDSVAVYFVRAALHGLRERPERMDAVLALADIDKQLLPDGSARVSAAAFAKLWLALPA